MEENEMITDEIGDTLTEDGVIDESLEDDAQKTDKSDETNDSQPTDSDEADNLSEIASLKAEILSLRAQLENERAVYSRMNEECAEFNLLYPSVSISSLSDSIWESVKKGVPIAAAYALEERRAAVADMKAQSVNATNRQLSSGSIEANSAEEFYTPDEVRAMSPSQVRENYSKIISSMSKWH